MRTLIFVIGLGSLLACTKRNSDLCCTDATDCATVGLSDVTPCSDGLVCRGNQCIAEVCAGAADCDAAAPFCDSSTGTCIEQCTGDAQCPGFGGGSNDPFCVSGACVQCRVGMDDCSGTTPICDANVCRGCTADTDCASGDCNASTGACVDASALLYASPGGADTAACTQADPCSLAHAIASVTPTLDTIYMVPGTYGATITIDSGATMTLLGHGSTLDERLSIAKSSKVTAQDLTLNGLSCYDTTSAPAELVLTRATINDAKALPSTLEHCHVAWSEVLDYATFSTSDEVTLTADRCVLGVMDAGGSYASSYQATITNSILPLSIAPSGSGSNYNITVDISYSTFEYGEYLECPTVQKTHYSNVIAYSSTSAIEGSTSGCYDHVIAYPVQGTVPDGVIVADPMLVDPQHGDYHLKAGSPAIDAADTSIPDDHDYDGVARPQGVANDIGAFEYH